MEEKYMHAITYITMYTIETITYNMQFKNAERVLKLPSSFDWDATNVCCEYLGNTAELRPV